MEAAELHALARAVEAREDREARRDARLYALLCNLRGGKKTWTEGDFYRGREEAGAVPDQESEEARQALEAYRAWVGGKGVNGSDRDPIPVVGAGEEACAF